ncbi:hypothetical protein [Sporosarcina sp. USHLN248]|uniref:hypothetical protein n=1 Tax=Sporosarcina sp. USHLN248 TaxID=3081300 RepID=UPI00301A04DD
MGDYTIERFLIAACVFLLILSVLVWRERRRLLVGLIAVVLIGYSIFFFVRGQLLEKQYEQSIGTVYEYLESQYPEEEWNVIDRLSKGQMRQSNKVDIVFANEKGVIYTYKILDDGQVVQWEINLGEKHFDEVKHNEKN